MAVIPTRGTNIRFLSGVPFSSDYKHTRWFDNITEQRTWFSAQTITHDIGEAQFQRDDNGRAFIKANGSIEKFTSSNYVMFQNSEYQSKWFYGFITSLEYVNHNVTKIHFVIDVIQTWLFNIDFKPSFVVREHCPQYNSEGQPIINTVDENLNYGLEYDIVKVQKYQQFDGIKFLVIVTKTPIHGDYANKIAPSVIGSPQPLSYYFIPFKNDNTTPNVQLENETQMIMDSPITVMKKLYEDDKAVNNVVSLYVTDFIGLGGTLQTEPLCIKFDDKKQLELAKIGDTVQCLYVKAVNQFTAVRSIVDADKYSGFRSVKESKLLMYPYTNLILDDFKGNRTGYKLEYINQPQIELILKGSIGLSNFTSYGVNKYHHGDTLTDPMLINANNESALINSTPNDLPIINDNLAAFLQGSRNQIQNQQDSIMFNSVMNGISSGVNIASSLLSKNVAGAVGGFANSAQVAGNGVLALQAIDAKQKDIANVPPSIQKMGSNTAYNVGNGYEGVYLIKKQIKPEYQKKLTDFFNMYGYAKHTVKIPNFHTRRYWNYIQTESCVITGNLNNEDLNDLKQVFNNGITLWHTDDVGNYALENAVI